MVEIDPEWASWFRGFFDGEGCFSIGEDGRLRAELHVREDDWRVINAIQESVGGRICRISQESRRSAGRNDRDCVRWYFTGQEAVSRFKQLERAWNIGSWESWFVGFFEAEGTFKITENGSLQLAIELRHDDKPILSEIQNRLGGSLRDCSNNYARIKGVQTQDSVRWLICGKENAQTFIHIFEGRMKTKKALDFEIWKAAAERSIAINNGKRHHSRKAIMLDFKTQLQSARKTGVWDKTLTHEVKGAR